MSQQARRAMRTGEIERESKERVPFFVRGTDELGNVVDPTGDPVQVAFCREHDRPTNWFDAEWTPGGPFIDTPLGDAYEAQLLVGGAGTGATAELGPGRWRVFIRPTVGDENPVIPAGTLTVH